MDTCSCNCVLDKSPLFLQEQEGQVEEEEHEDAGSAFITSFPEQETTCLVKGNNVSKTYLRKSWRKIQDQDMSVKSSSHKMYWEQSENTFCREFHRNWKISGKIRTKENKQ